MKLDIFTHIFPEAYFRKLDEIVKDKASKTSFDYRQGVGAKTVAFAQEEGLICRAVAGDSIAVCPPLIIDEAGINEMFDALGKALDKTLAWARKEGIFTA